MKKLGRKFAGLFSPWGSTAPDKQYFQLGLSALGGVVVGLTAWVALQSPQTVQRAYGDLPAAQVKIQSKIVASAVSADFGHKEVTAQAKPETPFKANRVAVTADDLSKPGLAFVVVHYGLSNAASQMVLEKLPPKSSVIAPAGLALPQSITDARAKNMEVWVGLALEPFDYPVNDAGPLTIFQNADAATNRSRVVLSVVGNAQAVGAVAISPSPIFKLPATMKLLADVTSEKGLGFLNLGPEGLKVWLDEEGANPADQILKAEELARKQGFAIVLLRPYASSLDAASNWARQAGAKGFTVLPLSAITDRQKL